MNKKYKFNKEWLDLMLENKNNTNLTFNLSDNDTRIYMVQDVDVDEIERILKEK